MINIKDKITFFYAIEEKLWGDKVNANKYFATICILSAALLGAWHTAGSFLESAFGWAAEISIFYALMLVWYMWVINIAESVFACKDLLTATLRSLLLLFSFVLAYVAGVILGTIVIIIVCVVLFVLFLIFMFTLFAGNSRNPGLFESVFGRWGRGEAREEGLFGRKMKGEYYLGSDGRQKFREDGGEEYDVK